MAYLIFIIFINEIIRNSLKDLISRLNKELNHIIYNKNEKYVYSAYYFSLVI